MKVLIKNVSIYIIFLSLLPMTSYAVDTSSLAGDYECQRTDPSNNTTSYPLTITSTDKTYTFQWYANGKPVLYGTGVVHSKLNNVISVVFWDPTNSDNIFGEEFFEIKPDGSLSSSWVLQSQTKLGSETCTKK